MRHLPGRRRKVSITLDDGPEQARNIRSVLFANCGLVPGGIDFIPQAMIDDGMLDVVVMSPGAPSAGSSCTARSCSGTGETCRS